MPIEFKLPQLSEGVDQADIAQVRVSEGDTIEAGQVVCEIETDKAVADIECPHAGRVAKVHFKAGDTVSVGDVLLTIEPTKGEGESESRATAKREEPPATAEKPARAREPKPEQRKPAAEQSKPRETRGPREPQPQPAAARQKGAGRVVVIGGGPGGYPAAFAAADLGMDVTLVSEEELPGGVCLHRGCIPSKALLHVAKLINEAREAAAWGVAFGEPKIDLETLRKFKSGVVGNLTGGVRQLCKARGVKLVHARGRFVDSGTLELSHPDGNTSRLEFDHAIVATGSLPAVPKMFQIGDKRVMDSTAALELPEVSERLLVIGGGYIGLEMGCVYAALGSRVTVVEMLPHLLNGADRDLVGPLRKRLEQQFEAIHVNTKVAGLEASKSGIVARLEGEGVEPEQTFGRVLVAVGRTPNSRDLGLENTQVELTDRGFIKVNRRQETGDPKILAVGDVAGEPMLAHKATREGRVAAEVLAGEPAEFDNIAIPAVVFTDPEVAWCGLTETEAKAAGRSVKAVRFPWAASGRAQTLGRTEGLTKLIYDPETERILGVGIVGPNAGELIAEGVLAVETACVARDLANSIHAHPTLSETLMESAEGIFGQPTHLHRPRR
jgi:dihydrolipoamide dehydrogenase